MFEEVAIEHRKDLSVFAARARQPSGKLERGNADLCRGE
jgi:hypothetical protein